jgi:hypothetical protein
MDQLKVILEHRFWVLSALAVLLPPIGWWVSTGDMATKTDSRTKQIELKVKSIESLKKDLSKAANKDWIKGADDVNVQLASLVDRTHKQLYEHQLPAMVYHPLVRKALDEAKVKYRQLDGAANPQAFIIAKRLFMSRYGDSMWDNDVRKVIEPFDMQANSGKVLCSDGHSSAQITRAPAEAWLARQNISSQEMWDAQEDLWMLHALMTAVARVNEGSVNIDDARIKKLNMAILRGGNLTDLADRRKKKDSKNSAGAPAGAPAGTPSGGLGWNTSSRASEADSGSQSVGMIDPDDIFGASEEAPVQQGAGGKRNQAAASDTSSGTTYVKSDPSGKWKARGFVLRVVMDHQEIPKLLTVLTEGPFPVEIWHVEHQPFDFKKDRSTTTNSGAGGAENDPQQKLMKSAEERVNLAMNQVNLAEVLVAGVFIFYNEPSATAGQPAAAPTPAAAPVNASNATKPVAGVTTPPNTGKAVPPGTSSPGDSSQKKPSAGKAASPPGAPPSAPKAKTSTAPAPPGPTTPKPVPPVKS